MHHQCDKLYWPNIQSKYKYHGGIAMFWCITVGNLGGIFENDFLVITLMQIKT